MLLWSAWNSDWSPSPTSRGCQPAAALRNLLEEAELADELGLDVFGVGEHHRPDFVVSAPAVVLAAIAVQTERIRLTSAVTVLSSDDPVRVFEEFATVDLLSGGRAEIMAGRGSFTESFPLFGYDLDDYDELFAEKLDLLLALRESHARHVVRVATARRCDNAGVWPRPVQDPMPVWIAVGGTPQSVVRAGTLGLPLTIAIIGGQPERFVPARGALPPAVRRGRPRPGDARARRSTRTPSSATRARPTRVRPHYLAMMSRIGRERGWPPMGARQYEALRSPRGALAVGTPEEVAEKILFEHELFGHQRYLAQMSVGAVAHADVMRSIERYGTEVAPLVRAEVARRESSAAQAA